MWLMGLLYYSQYIYLFSGEFVIRSGNNSGQKFHWLLENCPGYVGWLVGSVLEDCLKGDKSSVTYMANKEALLVSTSNM